MGRRAAQTLERKAKPPLNEKLVAGVCCSLGVKKNKKKIEGVEYRHEKGDKNGIS